MSVDGSYQRSQIFWHATELGEDDKATPMQLEHFEITTVEAMGSGIVPVVITKSGWVEIVHHGVDELL